jgi:parallel beta-helix repeat protein
MKQAGLRLSVALVVAIMATGGLIVLLGMWGTGLVTVSAQAGTGTIRVATTGSDTPGCGGSGNPCRTVQYAVDAADPGDVIKVAQGTYTDIHTRAGITQVVYISKTVTVQGGYTTTNWATPDPALYTTTLDAGGQGRGMVISGTISPTVEGLRITGGVDASRYAFVSGGGGGILIRRAAATIRNCVVISNTANRGAGGGLFLDSADNAILQDNRVTGNDTLNKHGGGISLWGSNHITLTGNLVSDNIANNGFGGGIHLRASDNVVLVNNTVTWNAANAGAGARGGGVYAYQSDNILLEGNTISNNIANIGVGYGGGLYLWASNNVTLRGNTVYSNTASLIGDGNGGGMYLYNLVGVVTVTNNQILSNTASAARHGWGGGVFLYNVDWAGFNGNTVQVNGNTVQGNTASRSTGGHNGNGGGMYLYNLGGVVAVTNNQILSNTASAAGHGWGGGVFLQDMDGATFNGNTVQGNAASRSTGGHNGNGGGLEAYYSHNLALNNNTFVGNTAGVSGDSWGGALGLEFSHHATFSGNTVRGNIANTGGNDTGGGLYIELSDYAALNGNTIVSNTATSGATATGWGGGLAIESCKSFTLTNNVAADNHANSRGSGLWVQGDGTNPTSGRLLHTTIADNHSSRQGIFVDAHTTLAFTNTIIAGHDGVGITVTAGSTATLEGTLWHNNGADTGGAGSIVTGTVNVYGDPAFAAPATWDYRLTQGSAAVDAGVDAGVTTDIDGDSRPSGAGYDIGADEFGPPKRFVYLPLVLKSYGP